ncbi:MAG: serine/threonine protein kinase [Opitutales bacterium]
MGLKVPHPTPNQVTIALPDYTEATEIGRGGFKTVFMARLGGAVEVVKFIGLPKDSEMSQEAKAFRDECLGRAMREIKVLGQCKSPLIVKLGTLAPQMLEIGGFDYVVYSEEHLDGPDLWKIIQSNGDKPTKAECVELMKSLLLAICELWSKGVIHRDIKPQNVIKLKDPTRPFVLLDLGIAFSLVDTALTFDARHRLPPATFKYLAPEMANPAFRSNLDYRSDLYSAALTVFEYAAHEHPLAKDDDDLFQTISRAVQQLPKPLSRFRSDLPGGFCVLIDQLLKKKPALRPANLKQLLNRLEKLA